MLLPFLKCKKGRRCSDLEVLTLPTQAGFWGNTQWYSQLQIRSCLLGFYLTVFSSRWHSGSSTSPCLCMVCFLCMDHSHAYPIFTWPNPSPSLILSSGLTPYMKTWLGGPPLQPGLAVLPLSSQSNFWLLPWYVIWPVYGSPLSDSSGSKLWLYIKVIQGDFCTPGWWN